MAAIGAVGSGLGAVRAGQDAGVIRLRMGGTGDTSFGETLQGFLHEVSSMRAEASDAIGAFVRGEPVEIHQVMAAAEEAGIALDMLIEIRNKLADAYRAVMQMQS
ncbi:MAG: flagellar hook-basal body complex protein FliE [Gemmatimonadetes bacterium]|nr:flagellar hook-basal body complex protein FliE [Gemmatimonadota bacterium]